MNVLNLAINNLYRYLLRISLYVVWPIHYSRYRITKGFIQGLFQDFYFAYSLGFIIPRGQSVSGHVVQPKIWGASRLFASDTSQGDLTERDWKNTLQGLGKTLLTIFKEFIISGFHSQISYILHSHVNKRIPVSANNFLKTTDNSYPSGFAAEKLILSLI